MREVRAPRRRWKYESADTPATRLAAAQDMLRAALARRGQDPELVDEAAGAIVDLAERIDGRSEE